MPLSSGAKPMPARATSWVGRPWMPTPLKRDGPRARTEIAHDRSQQGGLARAVPPDQADDLVRADVERQPAENVAGLDVDVEVADGEHQGFRRRPTTMSTTLASAWISAGVASARTLPWWSAMIRSE